MEDYMNNQYKLIDNQVVIYLQDSKGNITGEAFIDLVDLVKVMTFPNTWRLQKVTNRSEGFCSL